MKHEKNEYKQFKAIILKEIHFLNFQVMIFFFHAHKQFQADTKNIAKFHAQLSDDHIKVKRKVQANSMSIGRHPHFMCGSDVRLK